MIFRAVWSIILSMFSRIFELFCEKGLLRNLTKFTGKRLRQSLFFNKVTTLFKKRIFRWCFPVNFVKFLRTPFLTEYLWWLLLNIKKKYSFKDFFQKVIYLLSVQQCLMDNKKYALVTTHRRALLIALKIFKICYC